MTIRSILELVAQANATLVDNTQGDISADDVRNLIVDFLETMSPAYGVIGMTSDVVNLTATPQVLAPWTAILSETVGYYVCNLTNGTVTRSRQGAAGCTDFIIFDGEVEGPVNDIVRIHLYKNGAPTGYYTDVTCQGTARPIGFNVSAITYSDNDPVYDIRVSGDTGNKTFTDFRLICQAQPVRSFV